MRYTAKHLCKFFNINRETLRHYEKVGLVTPYIDPNSRYRYYDHWDVEKIAQIRIHRSRNLSLKSIKEMDSVDSFQNYFCIFENETKLLVEQMKLQKLVIKENERDLNIIKKGTSKKHWTTVSEPYYFHSAYDDENNANTNNWYLNFRNMSENQYIYASFSLICNLNNLSSLNYYGGTAYSESSIRLLNSDTTNMIFIPSTKCLCFIACSDDQLNMQSNVLEKICDFSNIYTFQSSSNIFFRQLCRIRTENKRYFYVTIPII
ncbi:MULTISPECIES: MerR family transcriptional regulator [Enterococcus]|uniref:MerR family transcriptional regulator n=1 Tax=Enterococcus thailandicus TaxID=417368 RepID=A0A510WFN1_ENTTH|nr:MULTISPECIES: MerR family transcriptional regulator [Enterococcus]MCD4963842.1 MerR family transcriptional regulator [Enterococcus casseliflavus]GEK37969.1 MerR family transcriptional regulator [Enterococcus thailandicus]